MFLLTFLCLIFQNNRLGEAPIEYTRMSELASRERQEMDTIFMEDVL
jgi:hypothetical protein